MKRNWHRPKESNLLLNRCDGSSALNKEHHPSWPNTSEQSAARSYAPYNRPVEVVFLSNKLLANGLRKNTKKNLSFSRIEIVLLQLYGAWLILQLQHHRLCLYPETLWQRLPYLLPSSSSRACS